MRMKGAVLFAAALGMMTTSALARTVEDVINSLVAEGYTITEVGRTLFGNVKIEATNGSVEREVIYNPSGDTVLRDTVDDNSDDSGSGFGGSSRDDDSGDDAEDDDSHDDDSGDDDSSDDSGDDSSDDSGDDGDDGDDD